MYQSFTYVSETFLFLEDCHRKDQWRKFEDFIHQVIIGFKWLSHMNTNAMSQVTNLVVWKFD